MINIIKIDLLFFIKLSMNKSIKRGTYNVIGIGCRVPNNVNVLGIGNYNMLNDPTMVFGSKVDIARFKNLTMGHIVLMGNKTWRSIPDKYKPLPGRINLVITRDVETMNKTANIYENRPGTVIFLSSISDAVTYYETLIRLQEHQNKELFVMGGGQIYRQFIGDYKHLLDKLYLTEIYNPFNCSVYFPWKEYIYDKPGVLVQEEWFIDQNTVPPFNGLDLWMRFCTIDYNLGAE